MGIIWVCSNCTCVAHKACTRDGMSDLSILTFKVVLQVFPCIYQPLLQLLVVRVTLQSIKIHLFSFRVSPQEQQCGPDAGIALGQGGGTCGRGM